MEDFLTGLNDAQRKAVITTEGPLLILAGAGAGKTKTVTHRIGHLLTKRVRGENILAITFTNKAATEMRERMKKILEKNKNLSLGGDPCMKTFHSLGVFLLRKFGAYGGKSRSFSILDDGDTLSLIKEALLSFGYDPKQHDPRGIKNTISRAVNAGQTKEELLTSANPSHRMAGQIWGRYVAQKEKDETLDFDDLLSQTCEMLEKREEVLSWCHNTWHYIHIDEYQDTNEIQYRIATLLAKDKKNICVVGDSDQSIYSWRGANIKNILEFEKEYPEAEIVILEENYRSTKTVLEAANETIKKNRHRKEKNLFTNKEYGEKISLYSAYDENDEARYIVERAIEEMDKGALPDEICVLYRTNFQSRVLESAFLDAHIPYQLLGVRFFERKEIKDILSYIRLILNPSSRLDLKRVINTPARGIGKVTLEKFFTEGLSGLSGKALISVTKFFDTMSGIREYAEQVKPSDVIRKIIEEVKLIESYANEPDGEERIENLKELVTLSLAYDHKEGVSGLESLVEDATLMSDQDNLVKSGKEKGESKGVKLMTVHAAKGLEFDIVFIAGLEQGLFPHERDRGLSGADAEEERRLMYVALTRARKKLYLSYASMRTIYGARDFRLPSEFVLDIPDELIERETREGEYGNGSGYTVYL